MALSDRLVNEVQFKCPGSTINAIRMEVWNVLDDFCREALAWRETVSITLAPDVLTYTPIAPTGTEIVRAFTVDHPTLNIQDATYEFDTLQLDIAPTVEDAASPLNLVCALTPAIDVGSDIENLIPVDLWSKHHRMFVKGVMALMLAQPAKPYANQPLAAFNWRAYLSDRNVAKRGAETADIRGAQLWSFPRFGR